MRHYRTSYPYHRTAQTGDGPETPSTNRSFIIDTSRCGPIQDRLQNRTKEPCSENEEPTEPRLVRGMTAAKDEHAKQ